jgi:hypothetical protein
MGDDGTVPVFGSTQECDFAGDGVAGWLDSVGHAAFQSGF